MNATPQDDQDARQWAEFHQDMLEAQQKAEMALAASLTRPLTPDEVAVIKFAGRL